MLNQYGNDDIKMKDNRDDHNHVFTWQNVTKKLIHRSNSVRRICGNQKNDPVTTPILNGVYGMVESGEFLAVMGLSGKELLAYNCISH